MTPNATGQPRRWTFHARGPEPAPGDLYGTARHVYLTLGVRRMADRYQTDPVAIRYRLEVVPVDIGPNDDVVVVETFPCNADGSSR
jgi:hypothetical protein